MDIISIIAKMIFIISIMTFGIISCKYPELMGAELSWSKDKWFYKPKYKKTKNEQYMKQIRILGKGLLVSVPITVVLFYCYKH